MLKFYYIHYTTYHKGKEVAHRTAHCLCDESKVDNWRVKVTWDNLAELWEQIGSLYCGFTIWNFKRGRLLSFPDSWPWQEPKEWKHADPQIEIECRWSERKVSIQDVMEWHDSEKAMQYLAERNLRIGVDK